MNGLDRDHSIGDFSTVCADIRAAMVLLLALSGCDRDDVVPIAGEKYVSQGVVDFCENILEDRGASDTQLGNMKSAGLTDFSPGARMDFCVSRHMATESIDGSPVCSFTCIPNQVSRIAQSPFFGADIGDSDFCSWNCLVQ